MGKIGQKAWNKKDINEDHLCDQYFNKGVSGTKLAQEFNVDCKTIYDRLRKYGSIKTNSESHLGQVPHNYIGKSKHSQGYVKIKVRIENPFYCMADSYGYVFEHRLVMAMHLGRPLQQKESIHHVNNIKHDNRIENLILFKNHSEHIKYEPRCNYCKKLIGQKECRCLAALEAIRAG